jgi:type III secretion protein I
MPANSGVEQGKATTGAEHDLNHFNQLMMEPAHSVQGSDGSGPVRVNELEATNLGDRILSGLESLKGGYDQQFGQVQQALDGADPLDVQAMMKLQLDLAKLSLQGELMNKTVSKSTQNLDTLLKSN